MADSAVKSITIYPLVIPMRRTVSHAASQRAVADPVVVAVELNSHVVGYGETLARPYVTGETTDTVIDAIQTLFSQHLLNLHPPSFPEALEAVEALPCRDAMGTAVPAARAAVELALLDAYSRHFQRPIADACGWMGFNAFGQPGSIGTIHHSGVLAAAETRTMKRTLRSLWWYGIRDFKIKVGNDGDESRLRSAWKYLRRSIAAGRATLRVDVNGAWTLSEAMRYISAWRDFSLAAVEQPLPKGHERELPDLKACVHTPLMYDESLVSLDDARLLVDLQVADAFNIRISKCGGFLPALRLAHFARKHRVWIQLGCMVGETSILSAAGRRFLELVPEVRFVEGSFGSFLLRGDVVHRPVRFGYAGRVKPLPGTGWGINVDTSKLTELTVDKPICVEF